MTTVSILTSNINYHLYLLNIFLISLFTVSSLAFCPYRILQRRQSPFPSYIGQLATQ